MSQVGYLKVHAWWRAVQVAGFGDVWFRHAVSLTHVSPIELYGEKEDEVPLIFCPNASGRVTVAKSRFRLLRQKGEAKAQKLKECLVSPN